MVDCVATREVFTVRGQQASRVRIHGKSLVVMTPKSLLRHKLAVSTLDELANGEFQHLIGYANADAKKVKRVVLCSGKVYYDLLEKRRSENRQDIAIVRLEQLYPFPTKALVTELSRFKQAEFVWCQEEPRNMGAWHFVEHYIEWVLNNIEAKQKRPRYATRPASAATAVGQMSKHLAQLKQLLDEALG